MKIRKEIEKKSRIPRKGRKERKRHERKEGEDQKKWSLDIRGELEGTWKPLLQEDCH